MSPLRHPDGYIAIAEAPERRQVGRSRRAPSERQQAKLSPEHVAELRLSAPGRSLRAMAAEFGVSHETVRTLLRERDLTGVA